MTDLEQHLLDLAAHGIRGDALAVRQLTRRLVHSGSSQTERASFFSALEKLLLQPSPSGWPGGATDPLGGLLRMDAAPAGERPVLGLAGDRSVDALVAERRAAPALLEAGLEPTRTVLLTGAPGVGKTMTATYLAHVLGLPLLTLDLAAVVSRYLGQTGQNLRQALEVARARPCVLLLDEFDALAKRRDDPADVGELKRIVNVLLLELERWPAGGVLVAATNHPELLDRAIWRRFERKIELGLPDAAAREAILVREVGRTRLPADVKVVRLFAVAAEGLSGSDLVTHARAAARAAVLGEHSIDRALADAALAVLGGTRTAGPAREAFCALARHGAGLTVRQIAPLVGVSATTVQRDVERWERATAAA